MWKCYLELIVVKISAKCRRHNALACWNQSVFGVVCFCAKPTRHGALACWNQMYTSLDTNITLPSTLLIHSVSLQKEFLFFPSAVLGCRLILSDSNEPSISKGPVQRQPAGTGRQAQLHRIPTGLKAVTVQTAFL
ncbi:uncharacterized protein [Apostichopus japonicus]|uniref:uncharacterized protein isoform X3 n=1 Tax=Stichopus japonicus TaxID=307972 RepID=UPI003AB6A91B